MSIDDTATPTVQPVEVDRDSPDSIPNGWPISMRWVVLGVSAALVAVFILVVSLVSISTLGIDKYILAPGSATNTASAVVVEGAETFDPEGEIAFTTVSIRRRVSLWDWAWARYDDSTELVPAEQIDGSRTSEETRQVTQFQMNQSQDTATLVALNYLGYDIVPEVEGAFVLELVPESPAAEVLRLGDLITEIDDSPVRSSEDLGDAIRSFQPGDQIEVALLRGSDSTNGNGADPDAEPLDITITLVEHPEVEGAGFLGVRIETPVRADAPFDVGFEVGRVRGPSAGLAFSLAIIDVLSEGELTGGLDIATTGTIDRFGNVGAVGGVPQKIEAARRAGITVFLVPPSELVDATKAADGRIDVRCVQTLDDAVLALASLGGNGVEVAEEFGAPAPEASSNPIDANDGFLSCAEAEASQ